MKVPHHLTGTTVDINTSHFHIFFNLAKIKCYKVHIDRSRTYQRCLPIAWVHSNYFVSFTNLKMFWEMDKDVIIKQHTSSTVADTIPWSSPSAILALGCEVFSGAHTYQIHHQMQLPSLERLHCTSKVMAWK